MAEAQDRDGPLGLTEVERGLLNNAHSALSLAQDSSGPMFAKYHRIAAIMEMIEDMVQPGS